MARYSRKTQEVRDRYLRLSRGSTLRNAPAFSLDEVKALLDDLAQLQIQLLAHERTAFGS